MTKRSVQENAENLEQRDTASIGLAFEFWLILIWAYFISMIIHFNSL